MKKIIIALSAITLLAACQKSLIDSEGLYENGIVAFQSNESGEMAAFLETSGPVTFTIASSVKVDKDVTVNFEPVRDTDDGDSFKEDESKHRKECADQPSLMRTQDQVFQICERKAAAL